ncbi:MAG: alpha/beta hydrolase [Acidimicrobiales bacterium]|jgi:pimeloyl-ACP methyl ester carboxylesterase
MSDSSVTVLPDGRDLGWLEVGDRDGPAVFMMHGTPGSRQLLLVDPSALAGSGVRFVCPDRPGYGLSSFHRDRRLQDWSSDVEYLADRLGIDRFAVIGHSGGGPHAAVCAALLGGRVSAAAIVSGVGPLGDPRYFDCLSRADQIQMGLAKRHSKGVLALAEVQMTAFRLWPSMAINMMAKQMAPPDAALWALPQIRAALEREGQRLSRTTARAVAQDFEVFTGDWGFELSAITVPTHIWHGDADRNVPVEHGRLMHEAIAGSVLHEMAGAGHFFIYENFVEVARALV